MVIPKLSLKYQTLQKVWRNIRTKRKKMERSKNKQLTLERIKDTSLKIIEYFVREVFKKVKDRSNVLFQNSIIFYREFFSVYKK